jgi:RNA polymerase sigma-70 factor, ECF subfamily
LIERLPEKHRDALVLTELEGLTQADAARRLGISVSGAKARVQRGRAQLRTLPLDCCDVALDRRGEITAYRARSGSCDRCSTTT